MGFGHEGDTEKLEGAAAPGRARTVESGAVPRCGFVYEEGGRLYFHRSWTGFCIYEVVFRETPAGQEVAEAWVSRERDQYSCVDDEYDARVLSWLIDVLLLKRSAPWPESGKGDEAVRQWSLVGRAMLAHDEDGSVAASLD